MTSIETIEETIVKCQGITDKIGQAWPHSQAHARALSLMIILDDYRKATKRYDERTDPSAKADAAWQVKRWDDELRRHLEKVHIAKLRESIHQTHHALADLYTEAWGCIA